MCCVLANCHRNIEVKSEPFEVADFLPKEGADLDQPDTSEAEEATRMVTKMQWLTIMFDGTEIPEWAKKRE